MLMWMEKIKELSALGIVTDDEALLARNKDDDDEEEGL